MGEIVNSDMEYKLGVEFVGQVEGGRWLVRMRGMEDEEDVGELLLAGGLAVSKEDKIINAITTGSEDKKSVAPNLTCIANPIVSNGLSNDLATSKKSCQPSTPPTVPASAGTFSRKILDGFVDIVKPHGGKGVAFFKVDGGKTSGGISKFITEDILS